MMIISSKPINFLAHYKEQDGANLKKRRVIAMDLAWDKAVLDFILWEDTI